MKKYFPSADIIRSIAILGVVSIHIVLAIYNRFDFLGGFSWWATDIWNAISRTSIPLFIMLSGFLLLPRAESKQTIYKRTAKRIVIPLVFWFVVYTIWKGGYPTLMKVTLGSLAWGLFTSSVFHLYFLIIMLGLYISIPVLKRYFFAWKYVYIFTILGFLYTFIQYLFPSPIFTNITTMWIPYVGYFLAGHFLGTLKLTNAQTTKVWGIFLLALIATCILGYVASIWLHGGSTFLYPSGVLSTYFDHYLSPNVIVMSLAAFLILIKERTLKGRTLQFFQRLSKNAFGIYLIHGLVIDFITIKLHISLDRSHLPLLVFVVCEYVVVLSVSFILTDIGRRIPLFKRTLGED